MDAICNNAPSLCDLGPRPTVLRVSGASALNRDFRRAVWTGRHLQVTLMTIPVRGEVGLELHGDTDQLLFIEQGCALVRFGETRESVRDRCRASRGDAVAVPAGTWHNVVNCGRIPLRICSVYAPPHHPFGTVHADKAASDAAE